MFIKKTIELNPEDLQNILINIPLKELNNEILSRDTDFFIDHLNESQQVTLLRLLLKDISISSEMEEELKYQMNRRKLQAFDTLLLEEIMEQLLKNYNLHDIFDVLSHLLRDHNL